MPLLLLAGVVIGVQHIFAAPRFHLASLAAALVLLVRWGPLRRRLARHAGVPAMEKAASVLAALIFCGLGWLLLGQGRG